MRTEEQFVILTSVPPSILLLYFMSLYIPGLNFFSLVYGRIDQCAQFSVLIPCMFANESEPRLNS